MQIASQREFRYSSSSAKTLLTGQDKPAPSAPTSGASCFVASCGVTLSEVGLSEIRKPQVARSNRVAGSRLPLVQIVQTIEWATFYGGIMSPSSHQGPDWKSLAHTWIDCFLSNGLAKNALAPLRIASSNMSLS